MFKFTLQLKKIKFNKAQYSKTLTEALEAQVRQAARAFLRAALEKVPTYTGMARGSLIPLGRFLNVSIPIELTFDKKHGHEDRTALGEQAGRKAFNFSSGNKTKFTFSFELKVLHYLINEGTKDAIPNLRNPTPWLSLDAGLEAFYGYLRENLEDKVPRIKDFVVKETFVIKL